MPLRKLVSASLSLALLVGLVVTGSLNATTAPPQGADITQCTQAGGSPSGTPCTLPAPDIGGTYQPPAPAPLGEAGRSAPPANSRGAAIAPAQGTTPGDAQGEIAFDVYGKAQEACTVTTTCSGGHMLSCTGTTCSGNSTSVTCNGSTTQCGCTAHCPNRPSYPGTCYSASGDCSSGFDTSKHSWFISCDGHEILCPACPNNEFFC